MGDVLDNIYKPGPLAAGGHDLMAALLGGGATELAAKQKEEARLLANQGTQASVDEKITQAYLARDKRNAQQGQGAALRAANPLMTAEEAAVLQNSGIAGYANLGEMQKHDMTSRAETALHADPNYTPANAILAALDGKPLETDKIGDGYIQHDRFGAAPKMDLTDLAHAQIAAQDAAARQHDAAAGASNAHAGLYDTQTAAGGYNPSTGRGRGGAGGKPVAYTEAPMNLLLSALDIPTDGQPADGVLSPAERAPYDAFRGAHPELRTGAEAVAAFSRHKAMPGLNVSDTDQHMTINGHDVLAPAGTDPQIVADLFQTDQAARADGDPLSIGQLRKAAEIKARGFDYNVARDGGVRVVTNGNNTTAAKQPAGQAAKGNQPSPLAPQAAVPHNHGWNAAEAQALHDARAAVATGKIGPSEARKRLTDAGFTRAAGGL